MGFRPAFVLIIVFLVLGATLAYAVYLVKGQNAQNLGNNNVNSTEIEMNGTNVAGEQGRGSGYQIISDHSTH